MTKAEREEVQEILYPLYISLVKEGLTINRKGYKKAYLIKKLLDTDISKKNLLTNNQMKKWIEKFEEQQAKEQAEASQLSTLELADNFQNFILEQNIKALVIDSKPHQIAEIKDKYQKRIALVRESSFQKYKNGEGYDSLGTIRMIEILMKAMKAELEIIGGLTPTETMNIIIQIQKLEQLKKANGDGGEANNLEDMMEEDEGYADLHN